MAVPLTFLHELIFLPWRAYVSDIDEKKDDIPFLLVPSKVKRKPAYCESIHIICINCVSMET